MEVYNAHLRSNIFNTMALPLLTYGCAVWGPHALCSTSRAGAGFKLDKIFTDFLKRSLGLGMTAPHAALKHELQFTRPSSRILQQILSFRENILNRPHNDLVRLALIENIEMANKRISSCWSFKLQKVISQDTSTLLSSLTTTPLPYLDPDLALIEREEKLDAALNGAATHLGLLYPTTPIQSLPDDARTGLKDLKYLMWCKPLNPHPDPKTQLRASFHYCLHSKHHIHNVARLRLINLPTRSETGRILKLKRSQRTCQLCTTHLVEDEYHLLTCPAYEPIRDLPEFSDLRAYWNTPDPATTSPDAIINHKFNPPGHLWLPFATLLTKCLHKRRALLKMQDT
jgi:hypothetical protein